jgi:hypothetical protein
MDHLVVRYIETSLLSRLARCDVSRVGAADEIELLVCPSIGPLGQYSRRYSLFGSFVVCRRGAIAGVTEQQQHQW